MNRVEAPDGSIVEFPDGTTVEVMTRAMREKFGGPPAQSLIGRVGQTADDLARALAKGVTFGQVDRLAGRFGGTPDEIVAGTSRGYEGEKAKTAEAMSRQGIAGTAAEIAGSLAPAGMIAKGVGLGARGLSAAMPSTARVASNPFAQAAVTGGAYGGTDAALNDKPIGENVAIGAGAGIAGQGLATALTGAVGRVAGVLNKKPPIPSQDALKQSSQNAYGQADAAGVIVNPQGVDRLKQSIQKTLADFAYAPELQPRVPAVLNALARNEGQNVTLSGLDTLRKTAAGVAGSMDRAERKLGHQLVGQIDDFVKSIRPQETLAGNVPAATAALNQARDMWGRFAKSEAITNAMAKAEARTVSTGSGGNIDNATRQELRKVLERGRNWSGDEKAALERAVAGAPGQNALRLVGKLSPSGNGLMAMLHGVGAVATGGATVPLMAAGLLAKPISDKITQSSGRKAAEIARAGGLLSATQAPPNAIQRLTKAERDRLARVLLTSGLLGTVGANNQP